MKLKKPDPRVLTVWRLRLIPAAALLLYLSIRLAALPDILWLTFTGLWICVLLFLCLVYYPMKYKRLSYGMNSRTLIIYAGAISLRIKAVPFHAVQYTSILTTPLLRMFGICSLVFYMAGSRVTLPGLLIKEADNLRASLKYKNTDGGLCT